MQAVLEQGLRIGSSELFFLIYSYVVNDHFLREAIGIHAFDSAPVTSDGYIQQQVEFLVERPDIRVVGLPAEGKVGIIIHKYPYLFRIPFQDINMEVLMQIGEIETFGPLGTDDMVVALGMYRGKYRVGHVADVLHDID